MNSFDRLILRTTWIWMNWNRDRKLHLIFTSFFIYPYISHSFSISIIWKKNRKWIYCFRLYFIINWLCVHYSQFFSFHFAFFSLFLFLTYARKSEFIHICMDYCGISFQFLFFIFIYGNNFIVSIGSQINTLVKIKMTQRKCCV